MKRFSYSEFLEARREFDRAVDATPEVARFCSSSLWQTAAHDTMQCPGPGDEYLIVEDGGNWLAFAERDRRRIFFPLEAAWMFGCPLIGDPDVCLDLLEEARSQLEGSLAGFCIGGIRRDGRLHEALKERRERYAQFEEFPATDSMVIDLEDGIDAWLERRSKRFRKAVRKLRLPEEIEIVEAGAEGPEALFDRILAIQRRSYKWDEGTDILQVESYRHFYRILLDELHGSGGLRVLIGRRGEEDIAYIFGGVSGDIYRGFQMSYVESARELGIGNALQLANLRARTAEGVRRYDLGMHSDYKERWADRRERFIGSFLVL